MAKRHHESVGELAWQSLLGAGNLNIRKLQMFTIHIYVSELFVLRNH